MKLLIADDSIEIGKRLKALFSQMDGIDQVETAYTIKETILALNDQPDILVLDLRFPNGSGLDVIRHINNSCVKPFILVLTNYPYPQFRQRCLELGVQFFFDKTAQLDQAIEEIKQYASLNNSFAVD